MEIVCLVRHCPRNRRCASAWKMKHREEREGEVDYAVGRKLAC